jgi:hypothetical protein
LYRVHGLFCVSFFLLPPVVISKLRVVIQRRILCRSLNHDCLAQSYLFTVMLQDHGMAQNEISNLLVYNRRRKANRNVLFLNFVRNIYSQMKPAEFCSYKGTIIRVLIRYIKVFKICGICREAT